MNANVEQELRVDLVFKGETLAGFEPDQVKRAVGDFFKMDEARRDRMFSGQPYVVKRGLAPPEATRYVALFEKLGGRLHPQGSAAPAGARAATPAAPMASVAPEAPAVPAAPKALTPFPTLSPFPPLEPAEPPVAAAAPAAARQPAARAEPSAPQLSLAPMQAPAAPPQAETQARETARDLDVLSPRRPANITTETMVVVPEPPSVIGVGLSGRVAPRPYRLVALIGWAAIGLAGAALVQHPTRGMATLIGLAVLAVAFLTFRVSVLRLHDIGMSGWWVLLGLVPVLGTIGGLVLALFPGSYGPNRYGDAPDPGPAFLRWVILAVAVLISAAFRHPGMIGGRAGGADASWRHPTPAEESHEPPSDKELSSFIKAARARADFREAYWPARNHKAFVASDSGAWGWSADASSAAAAREQAMAQCDKRRDAYSAECQPISVDGEWAE